jgi:hypothetical protein
VSCGVFYDFSAPQGYVLKTPKEKMSKKKCRRKNVERKKDRMKKMSNQWKMMLDEKYKIFILFHWKKKKIRLLIMTNSYKK